MIFLILPNIQAWFLAKCVLVVFMSDIQVHIIRLGQKTVFLGNVHYYMVFIAYYTELNLQICNYAQKRRICRGNSKYALDDFFCEHFCPRRKAANFCHPGDQTTMHLFLHNINFFLQQPTFMYHFRQNRELQYLLQLSASQLLFFFHLPRSSRGSTDGLAFNIIFRLPITIPYKDGACIHLSERKYCLRKKLNKPVFLSLECPCFLE